MWQSGIIWVTKHKKFMLSTVEITIESTHVPLAQSDSVLRSTTEMVEILLIQNSGIHPFPI